MKHLFLLLFLIPVLSKAQDCNLKDVKDPLNQDTRLSTGFTRMGGGSDRFMVSAETDKREIDFFFVIEGSKLCFDEYARVQAIFEGGKQKSMYKNGGSENCQGYFHIIFKNQASQPATLKYLSERKIISFKFTTKDNKTKTVNLGPEEQDTFQRMATCILQNSTALLNDTWKPGTKQ